MQRAAPRALRNLLTARHARSGDHRVWRRRADRGKEPHAADLERQVVVLALEPEGACHAATPSVEHVDRRAWNAAEQRNAPRRRARRLLVAVTMEEDAAVGLRSASVER